jgi:uncharacterized protein YndB with AHSA1/START domain
MSVTSVTKDPEALTLSITSTFDAPVERVWEVWADPRQLERWWGPPTYPATVVEHDLTVGGSVRYFMTGPEGDRHGGYWTIVAVDAPHSLSFRDGFTDESGAIDDALPRVESSVTLTTLPDGGTSMVIEARFPSLQAMEQLLEMGMEPGITAAVDQIDAILAAA